MRLEFREQLGIRIEKARKGKQWNMGEKGRDEVKGSQRT